MIHSQLKIFYCLAILLIGYNCLSQDTRNPWGINQQQYELHESTSVSELNAFPGAHPTYGALSLPDVSYVTSQPDNGSSPGQAQFRFLAAPSHYLKDDPIVFPDQAGASHLHMFFGNTRADAYSEVGTGSQHDLLIQGASTAQGGKGANPSSYWMPALVNGPLNGCTDQRKIILPDAITVYYKTYKPEETQLIPIGLELIGGNLPHNPSGMVHGTNIQSSNGGTDRDGARWGFTENGLIYNGGPTIPQTNPNGYQFIRAVIGFPQCFMTETHGGFKLSSPDHLSHQHMLEHPTGSNMDKLDCPNSHPNRIPKIEILIDFRWPADGDVSGWRLSSDLGADTDAQVPYPGGSLHGDILFAWNPKVQQAWKDGCQNPNNPRNCSIGQTGTQWNLDRFPNTPTVVNMAYVGPPDYLADPFDVCESCPPEGSICNDNNPNTIQDTYDDSCNCIGIYCPQLDTACDDYDPFTINDVYDANCSCIGTYCPPNGTACDDGDPHTVADVYDNNCTCIGTYCPPIGTACDDNNTNTVGDKYDSFCNCIGTPVDNEPRICRFMTPPILDGFDDDWAVDSVFMITTHLGGTIANPTDLNAEYKLGWDSTYLYIYGTVIDNSLYNDSVYPWDDDSFELFIDGANDKNTTYDSNDYQLVFRYNDPIIYSINDGENNPQGIDFKMITTGLGYTIEIRLNHALLGMTPFSDGQTLGLDIHVNDDDDGGSRDKFIAWTDSQNLAWLNPSVFGNILLEDCELFNCPSIIDLGSNQADGIHIANQTIYSSGIIPTGHHAQFQAGSTIELNAGFEVKLGATFEVILESCESSLKD